jgi:hypothetical protein
MLIPPPELLETCVHRGVEAGAPVSTQERNTFSDSRRRPEAVMKYMILIQSNPQFLERWKALPEDVR